MKQNEQKKRERILILENEKLCNEVRGWMERMKYKI